MKLGWDQSYDSEENYGYRLSEDEREAETPVDETIHAGRCALCGEPVTKGREFITDGDVFHRYLDASGRCAP